MAKPAKPGRWMLEDAAARTAFAALSVLPFPAAHWVGRRLGDAARLLDRRHRERARDQAAERLGLGGAALDEFVKANFRSYGMTFAEFCKAGRMTPDELLERVDMEDFAAQVRSLLAEGRGLVAFTCHFGNWEYSHLASGAAGFSGGSLARPLDNPRVDALVRRVRERFGLAVLDKSGAIRRAMAILRRGGMVGVLPDQDGGHIGVMSDFLGKPASTITAPVELAIRCGSPITTVATQRVGGKRFLRMVCGPGVHRPRPDADPKDEVRRLVDAVNADLSALIMNAPEQWMWIHRRWKSVGGWH